MDIMKGIRGCFAWVVIGGLVAAAPAALAQKKYDPGASDTEIRIGQFMPYSGPASAWSTIGKVQAAYFRRLNERGGINGRRITLISLDDGFNPAKAVEHTRRLVEQDQVLLMFSPLGAAGNAAVQKYLNAKRIPQLFVSAGPARFSDPASAPWTIGWIPVFPAEGRSYGKYILQTRPQARLAVLYQNDDMGKDYMRGLREGLGGAAGRILVAQATYEITDATIDSQIVALKGSGADTVIFFASPKFATQAIRKSWDIGWRPLRFLAYISASVGAVLEPAGLEKSVGLLTLGYLKDPTDPQYAEDAGMKEWLAFMKQYYPDGDTTDGYNIYGYLVAATFEHILRKAGDDVTRANIMKLATSLNGLSFPLLLPGVTISTSAQDYRVIEDMVPARFDGKNWVILGDVVRK